MKRARAKACRRSDQVGPNTFNRLSPPTLLIPSSAGHRIEHEKKPGLSGQPSHRRKGLRFELDGYRRIKEVSAKSGIFGS